MATKSRQPFPQIANVKSTRRAETTEGLRHIQEFLVRFGYLSEGVYQPDLLDQPTSEALTKYQVYHHLRVTGEFSEAVKNEMTQARCAHPDLNKGVAFSTLCAWQRSTLTFAFDNDTNDLANGAGFQAVRNAFQTWANIVPLTFAEVTPAGNPDILIGWRPANDADFPMVGDTLAHADFPPDCSVVTNTLPKPLHFDDTEHNWVIGTVPGGFDVETVALHEIGHIVGLQHSNVEGSVMFPSVSANFTRRALTADDIAGARELYPGSRGGRVLIADFSRNPPAQVQYVESWGQSSLLDGWHDTGDLQLVGDFRGLGHDQVLFLNRSGGGGRVLIADFRNGNPPAQVQYVESWGQSSLLDGWHDTGDLQLMGDFRGLGHDQVLFLNRSGGGGRVLIADFRNGNPPAQAQYVESWGQSSLLDGWHDTGDLQLVGDFRGLGHDQVLFLNRSGGGGRVLIADFRNGNPPAQVQYVESWGQSSLLDGWHDTGDLQLVGDFRGLGHDQVLFLNRSGGGGRVLIADFRNGNPPAQVQYVESWGQSSLLDGWHDTGDLQLVGDFRGLGHDQVLFLNRSGGGGRVLIADFRNGNPPAQAQYVESWGQSSLLDGWHDTGDLQLVGDFRGLGHDQVLFINRGQ